MIWLFICPNSCEVSFRENLFKSIYACKVLFSGFRNINTDYYVGAEKLQTTSEEIDFWRVIMQRT